MRMTVGRYRCGLGGRGLSMAACHCSFTLQSHDVVPHPMHLVLELCLQHATFNLAPLDIRL
jgi:hypothetical protein